MLGLSTLGMTHEPDHWTDTPAFNWTPEVPLRVEPRFEAAPAADAEDYEPRFQNPVLAEPAVMVAQPKSTREQAGRFVVAEPDAAKPTPLFLPRMLVGLIQGAWLTLLFTARPEMDPFVFSAALMVSLFAPLLLLSGMGRARVAPLLLWTFFAGALLAGAGYYHHWRTLTSDSGHPGFALIGLTALFLFIGQALVEARAGDYAAHYRSAWRLAIRIFICLGVTGLVWAAAGAGTGWMRAHYPALPYAVFIIPIVALSTALVAQLTGDRLLGVLQTGVMFVFGLGLIPMLLLTMAVVGLGAANIWQPSLAVSLGLGFGLILCINASYRDGTTMRAYWRRRSEFAGALVLLPLALIAGMALAVRVTQHGWTDNRIFAAAAVLMLAGYALSYAASALISLGGGGWMQRIEGSNLALAFSGLVLVAVLASPLADPARLAVEAQSFRLDQHRVTADAFDYVWLRDHGLRFGRETLNRMAASKDQPLVARGAFMALNAPPAGLRPAPTEIGANIHTYSGRLPAGLLKQDWSKTPGAPPCLTNAALACDAFFADLDGDGRNEIILAYGSDANWWASIMKQNVLKQDLAGGDWRMAGTLAAPSCPGGLTALRSGQFALVQPNNNWRDLLVGGVRVPVARPKLPAGCPLS
jgi:hypothetical protein